MIGQFSNFCHNKSNHSPIEVSFADKILALATYPYYNYSIGALESRCSRTGQTDRVIRDAPRQQREATQNSSFVGRMRLNSGFPCLLIMWVVKPLRAASFLKMRA